MELLEQVKKATTLVWSDLYLYHAVMIDDSVEYVAPTIHKYQL